MENSVNNFLAITGVSKSFGKVSVLKDINLSVKEGDCLALLGESGSGKTTLLKSISGFENIDNGEISLNSELISSKSVFVKPESRNIGLIFQDYALFPHLSVAKNILFGWNNGDKNDIDTFLEKFGLLEFRNKKPDQLSGGQQQRVAIARAVANNPSMLLLDEPFSNLDQSLRGRVRAEVKQILLDQRMTSIIVTHDPEDAMKVADEIAVLQDGSLIQQGTPEELYNQPVNLYVAQLMGNAFVLNGKILRPNQISLDKSDNSSIILSCEFENGKYKLSFYHNDQKVTAYSINKLNIGDSLNWGIL